MAATPKPTTAANAHEMFIAIAIMLGFVYAAAVIAGTGRNVGRLVLVFFVGLLILQGVTHVNPLAKFLADHPLAPR